MAPADPVGFKPSDGGWGWVVVFGAHISIGFAYSLPKVLSIFFKEIQEDLGTSFSEIALISSVMLAAVYGGGKSNRFLVQDPWGDGPGLSWVGVGLYWDMLAGNVWVCERFGAGLSENIRTVQVNVTIVEAQRRSRGSSSDSLPQWDVLGPSLHVPFSLLRQKTVLKLLQICTG